jgi:hypothetical protein
MTKCELAPTAAYVAVFVLAIDLVTLVGLIWIHAEKVKRK